MFRRAIRYLHGVSRFGEFCLRTLLAVPLAFIAKPAEVLAQFERVAIQSLPVVLGAGASVGLVTWFQTHRMLASHGAEAALPSFLGAVVLIEIGPMLASILVASRMGAGLAAELGTMSLNEEIDAFVVLGSNPYPGLVAPRAVACAIAAPLLTVVIDASALGGGLLAELTAGSLSPVVYGNRVMDFLKLSDVLPASLKTALFGLLIGLVSCWTGLNAGRSSEAVGQAATAGVVRSILAVFAANVAVVPMIQAWTDWLGWID